LTLIARNLPPVAGRWLVTDRQTAGRGRQGRAWHDGHGNFMGSVALQLAANDPPAQTLALIAGVALHRAVLAATNGLRGLSLKWPNDLLLDGAKLAGILLERSGQWVVVGVGVNLSSAPQLDRPTTALAAHGIPISRDDFAGILVEQFAHAVSQWRSGGWPDALIAEWLGAAHPLGTPLTLTEGPQAGLTAAFDGLEQDGSLRLRFTDGTTRVVHAGEVQMPATPAQQG
jgi:BirA family transcriptional regulator, biotin operon repressor / biotin---[acetyl-CoA-carboxylase] ligase